MGSLLGMGEKKKIKKLPVTFCFFMESRARSPKEMGREELCHEHFGNRSLQLSAQVALQGVLAWKWPEIHLCGDLVLGSVSHWEKKFIQLGPESVTGAD